MFLLFPLTRTLLDILIYFNTIRSVSKYKDRKISIIFIAALDFLPDDDIMLLYILALGETQYLCFFNQGNAGANLGVIPAK